MPTSISIGQLIVISVIYLLTLFATAWLAENNLVPRRLVRHPLVYTLSLGIYASAWAFYGSVGLAYQYGYGFLAIYLGLSGAFVLAPVLMSPILKLTRTHQLASLADLFAFRFRSGAVGTLTTIGLLLCSLPLLALQIQAVADTAQLLTGERKQERVALVFCLLIVLFSILFGARHVATREKHQGVVFAMAFESLLKLIAMVGLGGYALIHVFGGFHGLELWLADNQAMLSAMQMPLQEGRWRTLLLLFFASAIVMPHMYHMAFTENLNPKAMASASWSVPLYLLLLSLPIPLIAWAGIKLGVSTPPQYFAIGLGLAVNSESLALLGFMGGMSAASGVFIVLTLALSGMILNHIILPIYQPSADGNIYRWLKWTRRTLIVAIIFASYVFYLLLGSFRGLSSLGIISFAGALQFLPGVLALLYWPKANRNGFIIGTAVGMLIWCLTMLVPLVGALENIALPGIPFSFSLNQHNWHLATAVALAANCVLFVMVSLLSTPRSEEQRAAQACLVNRVKVAESRQLLIHSPQAFAAALAKPLGAVAAQREVENALYELQLPFDESRPFALRRLRDRIEANLSGLMGPRVAEDLINSFVPYKAGDETYVTEDIHVIESRLEDYRTRLTGLAAELDAVRRYHRQTLQVLPMGVCSLSRDNEILMWNRAMEELTGIPSSRAVGTPLAYLDQPWRQVLLDFNLDPEEHLYQQLLHDPHSSRWLNLHKAAIDEPLATSNSGVVLLIEDVTETRLLEDKLMHSQRLASLGRLAAGVAHEIGNPITGIACLAQIMQEEQIDEQEIAEMSAQIIEQTKRVTRIVQSMMSFSHSGDPLHEDVPVNLMLVCKDAINLLLLNYEAKPVDFISRCDRQHWVLGDPQRLSQVFINLLANARDASPAGSQIEVSTTATDTHVELRVSDQGSGISEAEQAHLFEPFFTTKDPGEGTGLGLAMVYSIIKDHGGDITLVSPCDRVNQLGTCFSIQLPRHHPTTNNTDA